VTARAHGGRVTVHPRHWRSFPHEHLDDVATMCVDCLAALGLVVDPDSDDRPTIENCVWDVERFPWLEHVDLEHPCWRPSGYLAPSLDELYHVAGVRLEELDT
jgi:hypothetical protein